MRPSQWVKDHLYIEGGPFSFNNRMHLPYIYDQDSPFMVLKTGRGCDKSTTLCNMIVSKSCTIPGHRTLYVNASPQQITDFVVQQLSPRLKSPWIREHLFDSSCTDNIHVKDLKNQSIIFLRPVLESPDRCRGIRAELLCIDELQDQLGTRSIPVLEQVLFSSKKTKKMKIYSGTPKTFDNILQYYWDHSSQAMLHFPCRCGFLDNIMDSPKYIGKRGPICIKCGKLLDTEVGFWVKHKPENFIDGFFWNQLCLKWSYDDETAWRSLLFNMETYPAAKFANEVLGISQDNADKPITESELKACADGTFYEHPQEFHFYKPMMAGIDWGCHDDQTRILTEDGFKYFKDLSDHDKVAQWDPDTRKMTFVSPMVRTTRDWDGELLHIKTAKQDIMVTDTHRMRVRPGNSNLFSTESAKSMKARKSHFYFVGKLDWDGEDTEFFTLNGLPVSPGYQGSEDKIFRMDDWVEFIGYLITEGGVCHDSSGKPNCLKMSQRDSANHETLIKIKACMDRMGIVYSEFINKKTTDHNWTICGKQYWKWACDNLGESCSEKRLPRELLKLSKRQLSILFDAMVAGDGSIDKRTFLTDKKAGTFSSTSLGLCEDFQEICIRLGMRSVIKLHAKAEGNRKARYIVSWSQGWENGKDYCISPKHIKGSTYKGKVYCCAVPTGYIVTERHGKVAYHGNTGSQSKSVIVLTYYDNGKWIVPFFKEFPTHIYPTQESVVEAMAEIINEWRVRRVASDWGFGVANNERLLTLIEPDILFQFYNSASLKTDAKWSRLENKYTINYVSTMTQMFQLIKDVKMSFPSGPENEKFFSHFLNVHIEYREQTRRMLYANSPERPDDFCHAMNYATTIGRIFHGFLNPLLAS